MVKALGIGFAMLLGYALLHTLPMQWILTVLILSGCVTLALLDPPQSDPRRWLPYEPDEDEDAPYQSPWSLEDWTMQDEREMAGELDYEEREQ